MIARTAATQAQSDGSLKTPLPDNTAVLLAPLLGALGVMLLLNFSLDNLSLMALTVATGFVVDDAIVVLENVTRHVEAGMSRLQAALLGAQEVSFTVLSISISLVAVFIPILLMGGIVGRLFREFAITLSAAILVSLVISLTTTPMMCAFLVDAPKPLNKQGRIARAAEGTFAWMQRHYERALDWSLDSGPLMLIVLAASVGVNIVQHDPSVQTVVAFAGNNAAGGFLFTSLKPRGERVGGSPEVIQRLRPKLARVSGASLFLNPVQDIQIGGRQSNATYQYTLEADNLANLRLWAGRLADAMKTQPDLTDVNTDQEDHGLESYVTIDRDKAGRLGLTNAAIDNTLYDAFGQRQVSRIYKENNQYEVVMEAASPFTQDPTQLRNVYVSTGGPAIATSTSKAATSTAASATATTAATSTTTIGAAASTTGSSSTSTMTTPANSAGVGNTAGQPGALSSTTASNVAVGTAAVAGPAAPPGHAASQGVAVSVTPEKIIPLSAFTSWTDKSTPTAVNHQDTSPATTISFNLATGKSLSDATRAFAEAEAQIGMPSTIHGSFQGTAKVFQQSLASEPVLILAALLAIYIVLGVLYESYIHPLTVLSTLPSAGLGAVIALILFHVEFSIIALIGVILLIGIVKKNAIMMIDFALVAEREQDLSSHDAIRQAALTRFRPIMMTTFAAMLGAVPLAIGWGEGSELRRPLGITIIGGLLVSQVITLLTTPVVYLYLARLTRRGRAAKAAETRLASGPLPA